jgi:hypothetical protein
MHLKNLFQKKCTFWNFFSINVSYLEVYFYRCILSLRYVYILNIVLKSMLNSASFDV